MVCVGGLRGAEEQAKTSVNSPSPVLSPPFPPSLASSHETEIVGQKWGNSSGFLWPGCSSHLQLRLFVCLVPFCQIDRPLSSSNPPSRDTRQSHLTIITWYVTPLPTTDTQKQNYTHHSTLVATHLLLGQTFPISFETWKCNQNPRKRQSVSQLWKLHCILYCPLYAEFRVMLMDEMLIQMTALFWISDYGKMKFQCL